MARLGRPRVQRLVLGLLAGASLFAFSPLARSEPANEARERAVMERFLKILEASPRRGTALDRVYGYHVERGTLEPLLQSYRDRVAREPHDGAGWLLLGLLESQRGHDAAAAAALRRAEAERGNDPLPPYYLGQTLVLIGDPEAAAAALERAIARKPARSDLLEIFQALGRIHQRARRNDKALEVWNRLEALFPDDLRVQEQIAATLAEEAQLEPALQRYERLADHSRDAYRQAVYRGEAAELKLRLGRQADALRDYERLLAGLNPESWLAREVRRKIEEVFLRNDDPAGLAAYYVRWLETTPDDLEAMARLGRTLALQGRAGEARTWLERALRLAPSRKDLRRALVDILVPQKKFAEAAAQFEAMSQTDPANPDLVRDWGQVLLQDTSRPEAERKQAAAAVWRRLIDTRPRDAATVAQVAELCRQGGLVDESIALYERAVALALGSPQYREYLGEYYQLLKRPADALATWRGMAAGTNRNAANLARLGEVLAGFGYRDEAIATVAEACTLAPDTLAPRLKHADLLVEAQRFDEAMIPLAAAEKLAGDDDEREAVLARQIAADLAAGRVATRIDALKKVLEGPRAGDAAAWRRLARYHEAARNGTEAIAAITKSLAMDDTSVPSWTAAARLYEATGQFSDAVAASRRLATLDRRARSEHLTRIARLETRLGRRDAALQAGRDLMAAAPGNPENIGFFADLCFQLGATDEGLDLLRRAVRSDENDTRALENLAEALAREFRVEEAIELYWRALERTRDLDGRLRAVSRLAELHLQVNQLDRLLGRLQRLQNEPGREREAAYLLAQAHASAGDFATARQSLDELLAADPRDTGLLKQLSELAEKEGDLSAATHYQKQLYALAPSNEAAGRLVRLALAAGDIEEAEAVWSSALEGDNDLDRALRALDQLANRNKHQTVVDTTTRLLRKHPRNWELLYREGLALWRLDRQDDAIERCEQILTLRRDDDEPSAIVLAQRTGKSAGSTASAAVSLERIGVRYRANNARVARALSGMDLTINAGQYQGWYPEDYGSARLVALALLMARGPDESGEAALRARLTEACKRTPNDPRPHWDRVYFEQLRLANPAAHDAARALFSVAAGDPRAAYLLLTTLPFRAGTGSTAPLPADELDQMGEALRVLVQSRSIGSIGAAMDRGLDELRIGGRAAELDPLYRELMATATDLETISNAAAVARVRGDLDGLVRLQEAFDRIPPGHRPAADPAESYYIRTASGGVMAPVYDMARSLPARVAAGDTRAILRLLDRYLDAIRKPALAAERARVARKPPLPASSYYYISPGASVGRAVLDYPTPGAYLDQSAILLLRSAFGVFQKADLLSDLVKHLRGRAEAAASDPEGELYARLALHDVLWWAGEKDDAVRELERALALRPGDVELKLALGELRTQRKEFDEALAMVDSIEPVDQDATRRRELMALGLATSAGRVERARQAAERLFGFRLSSEEQLQLAAQMQQLGLHELAEAVLARARRRAGNDVNALVSLMTQFERQNNSDGAAQVAQQILRRSRTQGSRSYVDEAVPRLALQVLARSGKLAAMITRLEAQLAQSPQSVQIQQTLAIYYRAGGQREKLKSLSEKMLAQRPEDARLRMEVAVQLLEDGQTEAACAELTTALTRDPSQYSYFQLQLERSFERQNRVSQLIAVYEAVGLKKLGALRSYLTLLRALVENPATFEAGVAFYHRLCVVYPAYRWTFLSELASIDPFWKRPESYDEAVAAMLRSDVADQIYPWLGFGAQRYNGSAGDDGRIRTVASRVLDAAEQQGRLEELAGRVEAYCGRHPEWTGGKALLAMIRSRQGKPDEARRLLEPVVNPPSAAPVTPASTLMEIAQELKGLPSLVPLAITLYERVFQTEAGWGDILDPFPTTPAGSLAKLYQQSGRSAELRRMLLQSAEHYRALVGDTLSSLGAYEQLTKLIDIATLLQSSGWTADALKLYDEVLAATDRQQAARAFVRNDLGTTLRQAHEGIEQALADLRPETLENVRRSLVPKATEAGSGDKAPARIDLAVAVYPRALDRCEVASLFPPFVALAAADPMMLAALKTDIEATARSAPDDLTAATAAALITMAGGGREEIAASAAQLERQAAAAPLERLPAGVRPNARQRADAARRLGLWLVARACWKAGVRDVGDRLAAEALAAAGRQLDKTWALAMLREWAQESEDRGDRTTAEARRTAMLDLVLATTGTPAATASAPVRPATATSRGGSRPARGSDSTPVASIERFEQAADIARLAALHGHQALSLRAVATVLRGGPPVTPSPRPTTGRVSALQTALAATQAQAQASPEQTVLDRLAELDTIWRNRGIAPASIYETLRDVVLPAARPGEIFLIAAPLVPPLENTLIDTRAVPPEPRSVAALLAHAAVAAERTEELRERIAERQAERGALLPALVLGALLAEAEGTPAATATALDALVDSLRKAPLQASAELACHAALPALRGEASEPGRAAARLIDRAIEILATGTAEEPAAKLRRVRTRYAFATDGPEAGRKQIEALLSASERAGDVITALEDPLARRKRAQVAAAAELFRGDLWSEGLDLLARFADTPPARGGDPSPASALEALDRRAADWPAAVRYERLRTWTFGAPDRKVVRLLAGFVAPAEAASGAVGVIDTASMLVSSAREAGKLDALRAELGPLADQGVENSRALRLLVNVAAGDGPALVPEARALAAEIPRRWPEKPPANTARVLVSYAMPPAWANILSARACLAEPALRDAAESMTRDLLTHAERLPRSDFKRLLGGLLVVPPR